MWVNKLTIFLAAAVYLMISVYSPVSAREITVYNNSAVNFRSIQEAVNNSSSGDIILVYPGIYNESVDVRIGNISVLSESENPKDTTVRAFKLSVNNITLSGFSIKENLALQGSKGELWYAKIENCTVKNNILELGIDASECYNSTIAKNVFLGKDSGISVDGYYSTISDNIVVDGSISMSVDSGNSILINNTLLNGSIELGGGYRNKIIGNNISNNNGECGICFSESSSNIIDNNSVSNANWGILMPFFSGDNQITNNTLTSNTVGILIAHFSSGSVIKNNTISNNSIGISLDDYALVTDNRIVLNKECGIYFEHSGDEDGPGGDGLIYNNFFNNTVNFLSSTGIENSRFTVDSAVWNTTKTPGTSITGGPYLGGNFWAKPDGTGFSETCMDSDGDWICDSPYNINESDFDFLPLASIILNVFRNQAERESYAITGFSFSL